MLTEQDRWNRYVEAINYCMCFGYYIDFESTSTGNVKYIKVKQCESPHKECIIYLKPRKYKKVELLSLIINKIGLC